jgi:hypothetical protein
MIYSFSYQHWISARGSRVVIGESEMRAHMAPNDHDADEWIVVGIDVHDIEKNEWVSLELDNPWWAIFLAEVMRAKYRTEIDGEWIAWRNAEGDAAIYGEA